MKIVSVIALAFCLLLKAPAETVAVQAAEDAEVFPSAATEEILTGALDEFFSEGFIVTSSKTILRQEKVWAERGLGTAQAGGVDFFLALEPHYLLSPTGQAEPRTLEYRLLRVNDGGLITEGSLDVSLVVPGPGTERLGRLRSLGGLAARASITALRDRAVGGRI